MFISLMTEQTEATEIKMNMRNINVITARVVPDKNVSDDFMHAVLSNCTTKRMFIISHPACFLLLNRLRGENHVLINWP